PSGPAAAPEKRSPDLSSSARRWSAASAHRGMRPAPARWDPSFAPAPRSSDPGRADCCYAAQTDRLPPVPADTSMPPAPVPATDPDRAQAAPLGCPTARAASAAVLPAAAHRRPAPERDTAEPAQMRALPRRGRASQQTEHSAPACRPVEGDLCVSYPCASPSIKASATPNLMYLIIKENRIPQPPRASLKTTKWPARGQLEASRQWSRSA